MGWLKRHTLISHSSGRWKSNIKVQSHVVSGENPLGDLQAVTFSICAHRERERERDKEESHLSLLEKARILSWTPTLRTSSKLNPS